MPIFNKLGIHFNPHLTKILKEEFDQDIDEKDVKFEEELIESFRPPRFLRYTPLDGPYDPKIYGPLRPLISSAIGEGDTNLTVVGSTGRWTDQSAHWPYYDHDIGEGT